MRLARTLVATALASAASAASTDCFLDARLGLGIVPGVSKGDLSNGGPSNDFDEKTGFDIDIGVQKGQYIEEKWGWVAGASLFYEGAKGDFQGGGGDAKFNAYGLRVDAGAAWQVTPEIHLELTPYYGLGISTPQFTGNNEDGNGLYMDYGIKLGGFYTLEQHWQGGIYVGWEGYRAEGKADYLAPGSEQTLTLKGDGFQAGITLGCRL